MPVAIRPAIEADQPTIRRLITDAKLNPMNLHWPNFIVAQQEGAIVGVGQVKAHSDGSRELASIAVLPKWQRQGIGRALIETLLSRERRVVLHLTCRPELVRYYERFGFRLLMPAEYPRYFRRIVPLVNFVMRLFGTNIVVMRQEAV